MDAEKQFKQIRDFLKEHEFLYQVEALERYGQTIPLPYQKWVQKLCVLSPQELLAVENQHCTQMLRDADELQEFIAQCQKLKQVPLLDIEPQDFHPHLKRKLTPKKEHEIKQLLGMLQGDSARHFIDIGSGAGHLSSALLFQDLQRSAHCIDASEKFQKIGKQKLARWFPAILERQKFICAEVNEDFTLPLLSSPEHTTLLGLHSCGSLSVRVLDLFHRQGLAEVINFGCCYHKLAHERDYNLSQLARKSPLIFSDHALTLAAKSHSGNLASYQQKLRVKTYRYGLHFFAHDKWGQNFTAIGNTTKGDAKLSFDAYLLKYLPAELQGSWDSAEAREYIQSEKFRGHLQVYLCLGSLRSLLGRLIELYLLLDRVLWLKEHGHKAQLFECFDPHLSPRNLGIIASR